MGRFTKRPYDGQRPSSVQRKIAKEIRRGRIKRKSPSDQAIEDKKARLYSLQEELSRKWDPHKREPLYLQYANLAASCGPEVFAPTEIAGIAKYSDLSSPDYLKTFGDGSSFSGQRWDFLPLHHIVKLLHKQVYQGGADDMYVRLLGSSSRDIPDDISARNLRALEYMLLTYAGRILPGRCLDLEIDGKRIQVPYARDFSNAGVESAEVEALRHTFHKRGISGAPHYNLRRIRDGGQKVSTPLHVLTEQRPYQGEGTVKAMLVSYLALRQPRSF